MKYTMHYDKGFQPMSVVLAAFKNDVAKEPHKRLKICVERNKGYNYIYEIDIFADESKKQRKSKRGLCFTLELNRFCHQYFTLYIFGRSNYYGGAAWKNGC